MCCCPRVGVVPVDMEPDLRLHDVAMPDVFLILLLVTLTVVFITSLVWVGRDARNRGRSSWWIGFLCLFTWPLGFLIWRAVRPPPRL